MPSEDDDNEPENQTDEPEDSSGNEPENQTDEPEDSSDGSGEGEGGGDRTVSVLEDQLERAETRNSDLEERVEELESELEEARGDEDEKVQKLRERVGELEAKLEAAREENRQAARERALIEAATKHGLTAPDVACRLADPSQLEITDEGEVTGAEAEIDRLREQYGDKMPNLFGEDGESDGDSGGVDQTADEDTGGEKTSDSESSPGSEDDEYETGRELFTS